MKKALLGAALGLSLVSGIAMADMASDVADPSLTNAHALQNAIASGMTEDEAAQALVAALIASGVSPTAAAAAAVNAGAPAAVAYSAAGVPAPASSLASSSGTGSTTGLPSGSGSAGAGGGGGGTTASTN